VPPAPSATWTCWSTTPGCSRSPRPPGGALYGASKQALLGLTAAWAAELGPKGIRVNALAPGLVATEGTGTADDLAPIAARSPARRPGTPADIAEVALYLAGDDSGYIHGEVIVADGGWRSAGGG
jgi:NAD(P)-dependent dehydrogenase (short-subunit alcohol dehydrogenase family)